MSYEYATRRTTPRQARRDHRRVRTLDIERTRAPSVGSPQALRLGRQVSRSLFTRTFAALHPIACGKCGLPRQRLASFFRLSGRSRLRVASQAVLTRKMHLTNFCNRLSKRAPLDCPISEYTARQALRPLAWCRSAFDRSPLPDGRGAYSLRQILGWSLA